MINKNHIVPFLSILILLLSCINQQKKQPEIPKVLPSQYIPVVMAYYVPEQEFRPEAIPVDKLTHIIFSFTEVIDGKMKFKHPEDAGPKLEALVGQKKRNPDLKIMIACGGWGADGFSDMALTQESREVFIRSAAEFIKKYELDGMDMDWEYPGISGAGTIARDEDTENFTALMKGLHEMLEGFDQPKILTFASAGWKRYYDYIEVDEVMKYADYMNVMTYDQVSGVSIYTGHHTPLGHIQGKDIEGTPYHQYLDSLYRMGKIEDINPRSTEKIVDFLLQKDVNPNQIVIGAAFYGRIWKGVPPAKNGLYQLSGGIHKGWVSYDAIRKDYESDVQFQHFWDETAKAPYMYHAKDSLLLSYDDTVSVALKTKYAIEKGLGGIMFWQLGLDTKDEGSLLDAIYQAATEK